jgi:hypothetical protein
MTPSSVPNGRVDVVGSGRSEVVDVVGTAVFVEGADAPPHADATNTRANTTEARLRGVLTAVFLLRVMRFPMVVPAITGTLPSASYICRDIEEGTSCIHSHGCNL